MGALVVARMWLPQSTHLPLIKVPEIAAGTVPVVVATTAIPYGGKIDASKLTIVRLPAGAAPQGAFATVAPMSYTAIPLNGPLIEAPARFVIVPPAFSRAPQNVPPILPELSIVVPIVTGAEAMSPREPETAGCLLLVTPAGRSRYGTSEQVFLGLIAGAATSTSTA